LLSIEPLPRVDAESLPVRGSCFGFQICSELTFGALRVGTGDILRIFATDGAPARKGKFLHEWRQKDFLAQIFFDGSVYTFVVDGIGSVEIDPIERTLCTFGIDDPVVREELVCGVPMAVCFVQRGDIALHAAAVEVDGSAVVLAGPGRYGKSTLAAAFVDEGHRLLSEDLVCLRPSRSPTVLPGPAAIRLRNDVAGRLSVSAAGDARSGIDRTRLTLDPDERGDSAPVPLGAILFLRSDDSAPTVKEVSLANAIPDLWALSLRLTSQDDARCFHGLVDSASSVPIFDLHRRLRFEDLSQTVGYVIDTVASLND
jgi:hypothetical protein